MKGNGVGGFVLEAPKDLLGFTFRAVTFKRVTKLHEKGIYDVAVPETKDRFQVRADGNSIRFPWVIIVNGKEVARARNLPDAAERIAEDHAAFSFRANVKRVK